MGVKLDSSDCGVAVSGPLRWRSPGGRWLCGAGQRAGLQCRVFLAEQKQCLWIIYRKHMMVLSLKVYASELFCSQGKTVKHSFTGNNYNITMEKENPVNSILWGTLWSSIVMLWTPPFGVMSSSLVWRCLTVVCPHTGWLRGRSVFPHVHGQFFWRKTTATRCRCPCQHCALQTSPCIADVCLPRSLAVTADSRPASPPPLSVFTVEREAFKSGFSTLHPGFKL